MTADSFVQSIWRPWSNAGARNDLLARGAAGRNTATLALRVTCAAGLIAGSMPMIGTSN